MAMPPLAPFRIACERGRPRVEIWFGSSSTIRNGPMGAPASALAR
jgi:hypothetical protein